MIQRFLLLFLPLFFFSSSLFGQCAGSAITPWIDQFYCSNTNVTLTPTITNAPTGNPTYTWTYQGNPISPNPTGSSYTIPTNQSGTYAVTVNYGLNCILTDNVVVGFLTPGTIGSNQTVCANGNPNLLTNLSSATIISPATIQYQWESSTNNVNWSVVTGATISTYDPPTLTQDTYYRRVASIVVNSTTICSSNSNTVFIDVLTNFSIDAGNNISTCVGQNISVTPAISGVTGYSPTYSWSGPNSFSSSSSSIGFTSVQQAASGQYTLSAVIGGCTLQDQINIDVLGISISSGFFNTNNSQLVACLSAQETSGDIGFTINLPSSLLNIQSININWGDGNNGVIASSNYANLQFHNYLPGSYQLTVTLISTSGCTQVVTYPVFVGSSPSPAALQLFINQANGCVPHSTNYTFSVPPTNVNGTTYTVTWGDGSPNEVYTHPNTPSTLSHVYAASSCGNTVTISGTTYNNVYQPSVITQNPCSVQPQPSAAGLISVGLGPDASFTVSKTTICPGGTIQLTNTSNFGLTIPTASGASCINTAPYYWVITPNNNPGNNWSVSSGSLGTNNGQPNNQAFWVSGTMTPSIQFNNPGIYTIELRVKNPCGLDIATQTICVVNPPTSAISPYSTIQCSPASVPLSSNSILPMCGTTALPVSYSWTVTNPTNCSSCSNTISSPSSANSNFTFVNNSNSIQTFTVSLNVTPLDPITNQPLSNPSCAHSSSINIQVYPAVQITPLTTCNGTLNWNLNNQVNVPSTFTWQAALNGNVSGGSTSPQSTSTINDVLVNTSTTAQTVTYTVNATSVTGSCTATNTFTVNLVTPLTVQPLSNQTICVGGGLSNPSPLNLISNGGSGTSTFSWVLNSGSSPVSTSASYSPPIFNNPGAFVYTGTVTSGPTGCVQNVSQSATITVVADPTISTQPTGTSYCLNASPVTPLSVVATAGSGTFSYQWYSNSSNSTIGGQLILSATSASYTPPNSSTGTIFYYCIISQTGLNCSVTSNVAQVVVNPAPVVSSQPLSQTICVGGSLSTLSVAYTGGNAGATYQWYSNTSASNTGGTILNGETNASFNLPTGLNITAGNAYYYCVINFGSGSGCSVTTSNVATISVLADPTFSVQPIPSQTICEGGSVSGLTATISGGSGAPSYQWYSVNGTNYTPITANGTSATYSPPTFGSGSVGTFNYAVLVTQSVSGCVSTYSTNATVSVVLDPSVSAPTGASYCQNTSPVTPLTVTASGGGSANYSYLWFNGTNPISGATSSSYIPPVTSTGTINYTCQVTIAPASSGCSVTSTAAAITVTAGPAFTNHPQSQTICIGGTLSALSVAYTGGNAGATYQWYSNSTNSNTGGTILNGETSVTFNLPTGLNNSAGTSYYYCVINFGSGSGCSVITSNVATISVLADPTFSVQPIPSQTICEGGNINALSVTITGGSGTPSYQWYSVNGTSYTPITTNGTSATYSPPTFGSGSVGTYNYALLVTQSISGCASNYSANATVIVVADPTVTPPVGASYCQNASPVTPLSVTASNGNGTAYTYQWFSNSINTNSGGNPQANSNSPTFTPPVNTTGTLYYYCLVTSSPSNSGCSATSNTATVTVNPGPSFSSQPLSQTICLGGALSALSVSYTGGNTGATYQWYSNTTNSNTGGTALPNETNASLTLPSSLNNTAANNYYYCVINFGSGSGCSVITSNVATISVLADPTFSVQPSPSQTICEGGSVSGLTATILGGSGTPSYQWYSVNGTTYAPVTSNGTSATYSPPTFGSGSVGTYNYALLVTQSISGCASSYSANATVIVVADPTVTPPVGASYCQNASPVTPLTVTASGGGSANYSYLWFNGTNPISGATSSSYIPPVTSTGTINYTCQVTIAPASSGCSVTSTAAAITVTAGPAFTNQPQSQTICIGGTLSALNVAYSGGSGTSSYQWYSNTTAANTGGTILNAETNATFSLPSGLNNTAGNAYYYCVINFGSGSGCSVITSNVATISVLADPAFSVQPTPSQTICEGGSVSGLTATILGGSGTPSYQWYTVSGTNYTPITTNGTSATYTPQTFTLAGTFNYAVLVTQSVSGCASTYSANATVSVVLDPSVTAPAGASYCQNASPVTPLSVTASNGNGSAYTYQWFANSTNTNSGGTQQANSNSPTFTPPVITTGTLYYYCVVTNSPSNSGCSTASNTATINVNAAPTFSTPPLTTQTVCLDGSFNALTVTTQNGTGTPTFQWYSNTTNTTTGGALISGATAANYTPAATAVGTTYYYCIATFATGGCSNITSTIAAAIVVADPVISAQPTATQSICVGGTLGSPLTITATGGTGTYSYQWSNAASAITGATNQNFTPPAFTTVGQYNYTVTITQSGSGCNAMISQNALIDVVADPVVSTQPINAEYCQNASPVAPLTVSATGGLGTFSYQWYSNTANNNTNGSLIPGATSSSFTPSVATVGTTYYYCVITQTGLNCGVTSNTAAIIVNPAPTFATQPIASQTVCVGGAFNALTVVYQNGTGTPTYQWFSNSTSSTSNGTFLPNETNASYTPPTNIVGTTYYYCVATFASGGCSAITSTLATATVVADPTISIQPIPTQSICVGGTIASALTATAINGTGSTTYQWSNSTGTISGATSQTYLPSAFTAVGAYTYLVTITLSGSGCNAAISQNAVIDVVADPVVSVQPISASYCQNGTPVTALTVGATGGIGTFSYQWYSNNTNSNTGGTILTGANTSTYTPSVSNIGTIYYYCVITQSGLNCGVTSNTAGIVVNQAPSFLAQPISQTICSGGTFDALTISYQFGTGVPTYQWFSNSTNSYTGAVAIAGATAATYQPSSIATGSTYYFCVISFSFGGCTNISSNISNQVVVVDPAIVTQPLINQTICVGGTIPSPFNVIVTGGTGATSYQWFQGANQINNAIQSTYLPDTYLNSGIYTYQVNINSTGVGCDALVSQQVTVEVLNDPLVTTPSPAIYCQNAALVTPLQVNVSGGSGTINYQWYYSTSNTNSGGVQIAGAGLSTYTPSVSIVGTSYYYCIVTQSTPNCANVSNNAAIQINQPPTISAQPIANQTLCEGGTPTALQVNYINGTNSATYQWYESNSNSNTGGTPLQNETSSSYVPPTVLIGSLYYYCVITFQQGGCSTLTSATAQVSIVNDPAINVQPLNAQEICQGNTVNSALNFTYSGGTGNATIAWYLNASPPVLINGITTTSYLPIPFNVADTFSYYATLSFDGVGCNSVSTQMAEIVVHPTPYALNLNDTIVVCNHSNLAIPLTASVTSTFVWHTTNNPSVTGESFLNQTSYTIDDSLNNNSTNPQFLTYTVTPTSFPYGCVGPDSIVTVQVQPDVILSMNPSMEICSDSPVNAILTSNIPSTFTWFVSVNNPNVTGESIIPSSNSIVNDVLVNTSTTNQVVVYSVFPISILGQCPGLAQPLVVTVKPPIQLLNPDTLTICSGQNTNINLVANTNVQFNWYASPSLNVLNETTNVIPSSLINDVLVNPTNAVETVTYNVIGTSTANGCSSPVLPLYVVVNPIPELQNVNPITICNGAYLYPVSLQTTVNGGTTNWTVLNNNIGIPSTFGSNTLPGFVATNNTIITQTGQVSVTPIFTNNSVTCIGVDTTLFINVLPTPSVNPIADIVACNLEQVPLTPISGPVPNNVFQWINANTNVGLNVSGIGDIPIFVGQNPGTLPITGTVSVAPSVTQSNVTCQGTPIEFTITINPSPTLLNNDIEICNGNYTNILLNANISSTFIWNATINQNVYNETSTPIQTSAFINDQLTLAGTSAQTVIYNVTPVSTPYGCYGNDTTINVLINPLPIVDFTIINPILCDQSLINFQNNSVGPLAYTWTFGDGDSSFLFNPVHEYANFGSYLVTLSAIDQITGCVNEDSQTLIIHETPEPDFILSDSLACGSLDVVFTALDLNPTWQYQWDFGDGASSNQFGLAGHQFVTNGCFDVSLVVTTPQGCTSNSTQLSAVCIYPEPMASFSIDDAVISSLAPDVTFFNTSVHADTYLWDFGDNTTSLTQNPTHLYPSDPATYVIILTASNNVGCQDTAALSVTIWQDLAIYVPNTFTPDGDEHNQTFFPVLTEGFDKENYHLLIFDRWGELIFESYDYTIGWDGTYGPFGIACQIGTYTWKILVDELQSGDTRRFLGHVNLIR